MTGTIGTEMQHKDGDVECKIVIVEDYKFKVEDFKFNSITSYSKDRARAAVAKIAKKAFNFMNEAELKRSRIRKFANTTRVKAFIEFEDLQKMTAKTISDYKILEYLVSCLALSSELQEIETVLNGDNLRICREDGGIRIYIKSDDSIEWNKHMLYNVDFSLETIAEIRHLHNRELNRRLKKVMQEAIFSS